MRPATAGSERFVSEPQGHWSDLSARMLSGAAMALIGALAVVAGGVWFQMLVVFATAVMIWELWMMIAPDRPVPGMLLAALVASVISAQIGMAAAASPYWIALFGVAPLAGALAARREKVAFLVYALMIQTAGWGIVHFRNDYGFGWILWLLFVVIASDIGGYFAGRALGGPKFWPAISPKKTWSGTIAGWLGAALIGLGAIWLAGASWQIVPVSVALCLAGQMGDIAESALKRRLGVKDSSALIPGHGGLFDRFDALLGACLFLLLAADILHLPGVGF
jgi:phosphatidate cytidylyltransferase